MQAEEMLRAGRLHASLEALQAEVRARPADAQARVFLFQLLCVLGQWDRALTQLRVAADLDAANLLMAQVGREALACEVLRQEIFAGRRGPMIFGEPEPWTAWLVQANELAATGRDDEARSLREAAFEAAPAVPGTINGVAFEWLADADGRLGPVLEALVDGKYFWIPMSSIQRLEIEPPEDLRDLVWAPAQFTWTNGGAAVGFIPSRYVGSDRVEDEAVALARKTVWQERPGELYVGLGQRLFATDVEEYPLLETRTIEFQSPGPGGAEGRPMPELTPHERLQPSLLDRLTDEHPDERQEGRDDRVLSLSRYRQAVLRDIGWLLNTAARVESEYEDYPEVGHSVLCFGVPALAGATGGRLLERIERSVFNAIRAFEPRILRQSLSVDTHGDPAYGVVAFEIRGDLWGPQVPDALLIKTQLDLERGHCKVEGR